MGREAAELTATPSAPPGVFSRSGGALCVCLASCAVPRLRALWEAGARRPVLAACTVRCQAGRLNGTVTVMVSGNQRAPPACCGAPHTVCRYLIGGPKPPSVSLAGNP